MKVAVLLVIVAFSTFVQSYKLRIIRKRYKHKANRTAAVNEHRTVLLDQDPNLDNYAQTQIRQYFNQAPDETAIKVIPAPRINRVVANLCKDTNKDILAVWETVARNLGLDKGYPIQHPGELRKLTTIIRTFVTLSKENDFEQMPVHRILQTIDYNLERVTDRNDVVEESIETLSRPYYEIPTLGSSTAGNEKTYLDHLVTAKSGFDEDSLSAEPVGVPSSKTPIFFYSNENILEPTDSVNLEEIETEIPFEPSIDSNLIESISTERPVELENGYKIIPATPSFLDSDELVTVIPPEEIANDEISAEIPLDKKTIILTTATSLNPEEHITVNALQQIDSVDNSLEPIDTDAVMSNFQSAEDTSEDEFTGSSRRSYGTLLDLLVNLIESSNETQRKGDYDAINEDTSLHLDSDNKTPDYLNPHDSGENGAGSEAVKIIPFDSADLDEDILPLSLANSDAASLESNNDAINTQIDASDFDTDTNTLVTSSYLNSENPLGFTSVENDFNDSSVSDSPLSHTENISSEEPLDPRLLKIEEEFTVSPGGPNPSDLVKDQNIFRTPDYIQAPFTSYDMKTSQINLNSVEPKDETTRRYIDPVDSYDIDTSGINLDLMDPYVVDASRRNLNPADSYDVATKQINLDSIVSYDEDTSVRNFYPVDSNDVEINQINVGPSVIYNDVDTSQINLDPIVTHDLVTNHRYIDRTVPFDVDSNLDTVVPFNDETRQINLDTIFPYDVHTSQENLDPTVPYDVDTSQENLDATMSYDAGISQINLVPTIPSDSDASHENLDPTVPFDVNEINLDAVARPDVETSQINLDRIFTQDITASQRNFYPIVSQDTDARRKSLHLIIPYDVKGQPSLKNLDPDNNVGTSQTNLDPIAPYVVETRQRYYDPVVPYDVETSRKNHELMAPYVIDMSKKNLHLVKSPYKIEASQITRKRKLKKNRINYNLIDRYEFDVSRKHLGTNSPQVIDTSHKNLHPFLLHHKDTSDKNLHPINIKMFSKNLNAKNKTEFSFDNRYNLEDEIVFSILPELLSRYSDCKNKARSVIINELKKLVIALESNTCHQSS